MSSFDHEQMIWVDPYIFPRADQLFDPEDSLHQASLKKLRSMNAAHESLSLKPFEEPMPVGIPIDLNSTFISHVAVANDTFVVITKNLVIHFFDQVNRIPMNSVKTMPQSPSAMTSKSPPNKVV